MSSLDAKLIGERIQTAGQREQGLADASARDVAFHMTDWLGDLEDYFRFCTYPHELTDGQLAKLLMRFLVHAPNHTAAAAKLYTGEGVTDVFDLGATGDEDAK